MWGVGKENLLASFFSVLIRFSHFLPLSSICSTKRNTVYYHSFHWYIYCVCTYSIYFLYIVMQGKADY